MFDVVTLVAVAVAAFFIGLLCGYRYGFREVMGRLFSAIDTMKTYSMIKRSDKNESKTNGKPE